MKRIMTAWLCLVLAFALFGCGRQSNPVGEVVVGEIQDAGEKTPTAMTYSNGMVTVRFVLNEKNVWQWVDDTGFPLDGEKMQEMLDTVGRLAKAAPFSGEETPEECGLENSGRYLAMSYSDESKSVYYFGKQDEGGKWYMRSAEEDAVFLVEEAVGNLLDRSIYDMMIMPDQPVLTEENVKSVTVQGDKKTTCLTWQEGTWKKGTAPAAEKEAAMAAAALHLTPDQCADYSPAEGAKEVCGLQEPTLTVEIRYINTVEKECAETFFIGNYRENADGYYMMMQEDSTIYLVSAAQILPILEGIE